MVVVVLAFFGLCVAFVGGCSLILGSPTRTRRHRPPVRTRATPETARPWRRSAMSTDNVIALVLSVLIAGYLVFALLSPEKL